MKKILNLILCGLLLLGLTGCGKENLTSNFEEEYVKTWQDDAKKFDAIVMMNNLCTYRMDERFEKIDEYGYDKSNLFLKKYIEEYEKMDFESLTEKEQDFLSLYFDFVLDTIKGKNHNNYSIKKIWSFNYENNGAIKEDAKSNYSKGRGFIIKMMANKIEYVVVLATDYYSFSDKTDFNAYLYEDMSYFEKAYGVLKENRGVLNNFDATSIDKSGINYISEDKEPFINLIEKNKSFFDFISEYSTIYNKKKNMIKPNIPVIGMSKESVIETDWGSPDRTNFDVSSKGIKEQWVYDDGRYVYFENEVVKKVVE